MLYPAYMLYNSYMRMLIRSCVLKECHRDECGMVLGEF